MRAWLLLAFIGLSSQALAQPTGQEWINYSQRYFKFSIAQNGVYRISFNELQAAGFPVSTVDPRTLQLFFRGQEQNIFVAGQLDGRFDPTDFIEFYGRRNDGTLDQQLFEDPNNQPHPFYNIWTDSAAYFLTWRLDGGTGRRMGGYQINNTSNLPAQPAYTAQLLNLQTTDYNFGTVYPEGVGGAETWKAGYDAGEGWTGADFFLGQSATFTFTGLEGRLGTGTEPTLTVQLSGRNNLPHRAQILVGPNASSLRVVATQTFNFFNSSTVTVPLQWDDLGPQLVVQVQAIGANNASTDRMSVSYLQLDYAHQTLLYNAQQQELLFPATNGNPYYIEIQGVSSGSTLLDITLPDTPERIGFTLAGGSGGTLQAVINGRAQTQTLLVDAQPGTVGPLTEVRFRNIDPTQHNYLIISHPSFRQPGGAYADPVPRQRRRRQP